MSQFSQAILNTIQKIARNTAKQHEAALLFGEVISTEPLKIKVDGRYEISESFIVLGAACKETRIKIPVDSDYEHNHEMDESLGYLAGTGNMGAPVMFVMAGVPPTIPNPDYISPTETPSAPPTIPNPAFDPSTATPTPSLKLTHKHLIHKALPEILLWRGLQKGDKVKILRLSVQLHYVLERVEGITNDPE